MLGKSKAEVKVETVFMQHKPSGRVCVVRKNGAIWKRTDFLYRQQGKLIMPDTMYTPFLGDHELTQDELVGLPDTVGDKAVFGEPLTDKHKYVEIHS